MHAPLLLSCHFIVLTMLMRFLMLLQRVQPQKCYLHAGSCPWAICCVFDTLLCPPRTLGWSVAVMNHCRSWTMGWYSYDSIHAWAITYAEPGGGSYALLLLWPQAKQDKRAEQVHGGVARTLILGISCLVLLVAERFRCLHSYCTFWIERRCGCFQCDIRGLSQVN